MQFDIRFLSEPWQGDSDASELEGLIWLGTETDGFVSPVGYWRREDYEAQWLEGIRRVAFEGWPSCLVVSAEDPALSDAVVCYLLYPLDDRVLVRELLLFRAELPRGFDPRHPYTAIPTIDGSSTMLGELPVSEWNVALEYLVAFLEKKGE